MWGLIGASDIAATRLLPTMRSRGDVASVVLSSNAARGDQYAARHGVGRGTTDLDDLLADPSVEAVYISTVNDLHAAQARAAIAAGKHVLCEKPITLDLAEAVELCEQADAAGVVLAVNHHLPGAASHAAIRRLVARGAVGDVLAVRVFHAVWLPKRLQGWRLDDVPGAGVILDVTVHDASVVNALLPGRPLRAVAIATRQGSWAGSGTVEDSVMSAITYDGAGGPMVQVQTHDAFTVAHAGTGLEVHGTAGSIVATDVMSQDARGEVVLIDGDGRHVVEIGAGADLYRITLDAFGRAMVGTGAPAVDGRAGTQALAVALAVSQAARTGRSVDVASVPARPTPAGDSAAAEQ